MIDRLVAHLPISTGFRRIPLVIDRLSPMLNNNVNIQSQIGGGAYMADEGDVHVASEGSTGKWILLALAAIYVAGSLYFIIDLRGRLDKMKYSENQVATTAQLADLGRRMQSAEA